MTTLAGSPLPPVSEETLKLEPESEVCTEFLLPAYVF